MSEEITPSDSPLVEDLSICESFGSGLVFVADEITVTGDTFSLLAFLVCEVEACYCKTLFKCCNSTAVGAAVAVSAVGGVGHVVRNGH